MRARLPRLVERTRRPSALRRAHAPSCPPRTEERPREAPGAEEASEVADTPGPPSAAPTPIDTPERRARASGGPQDHAMYSCSCGYVFDASVSTSVHCPHCGDTQAW